MQWLLAELCYVCSRVLRLETIRCEACRADCIYFLQIHFTNGRFRTVL